MEKRKFEQKLKNVIDWKTIADLHWERILGEYSGDAEFWNDLFHSMQAEDWWDVLDVAKALQIQHPEELRRFSKFPTNLQEIEVRLLHCRPVIKQWNRQGYNVPATGLFMSVRDALNEIMGTPTPRWTDEQRQKIMAERAKPKKVELFERI